MRGGMRCRILLRSWVLRVGRCIGIWLHGKRSRRRRGWAVEPTRRADYRRVVSRSARVVSPPVTGVWVRPDWVESELELPGWCWVLYVLVVGLLAAVGAVLGPVVAWWMGWL